jgi:hypothetical protein
MHAFRGDDLVVKTLMLKALVPNVPALKTPNPGRLAALNHGWIPSMLPGRQGEIVAKMLRDLAGEFGEIRLQGETNPTVDVALIGIDTKSILEKVLHVDDDAARRRLVKDILWEELKAGDLDTFVSRRTIVWRGTTRVVELAFVNVADPRTAAEVFAAEVFAAEETGALRVVVDYPFDNVYGPADDRHRIEELRADPRRANLDTLCWLPSFFSADRLSDLGELVKIKYVLEREDRLRESAPLLTDEDRDRARTQLESRSSALETRIKDVLKKAYGLAAHDDADIGQQIDQHIMGMNDSVDIRPPAALGFDAALEHICGRLLDHRYPRHPDFAAGNQTPYRLKDLQTALGAIERAMENKDRRHEPARADIPTIRRIVNPLDLGVMGEAALVLNDNWPMALDRLAGQVGASGEMTVAQVRGWIEKEQPGLPPDVANLVVCAYALMRERAWVRAGQIVQRPDLRNIPGDYALRPLELPSPEEFEAADRRAAELFQQPRQQVRSPRTVHALADRLRRVAGDLLQLTEALVDGLERHTGLLGLDEGTRLPTARTAHRLVEALVGQEDTPLLRRLAEFDLDGTDPVARHDEQAAALGPALKNAKDKAFALLVDITPPPPPPGGKETGQGTGTPPDSDSDVQPVRGEAQVFAQGLDSVVEQIRAAMAERPDAEFLITWRSLP